MTGAKVKILHHSNQLGIGGTEKCMQYFLEYLKGAGHDCWCMHNRLLTDRCGRTREALLTELLGAERVVSYSSEKDFFDKIASIRPDIFHAHRSGGAEFPLVQALSDFAGKIVETNVFGGRDKSDFIDMTLYVNVGLRRAGRGIMRRKHILFNPVKMPAHSRTMRSKLGISQSTFVMGRIGRPDDRIFDPISLLALKNLEDSGVKDILYLVQSPPPVMISAAREIGVKNVRFLNESIVGEEDVTEFFNTIDVLAHARRDGETFGLNIAEAMIHGKPVVSHKSRVSNGHAEFVRVCGFMAPVDGHAEYAAFIRKLFDDRSLAGRLGAAGRAYAEEKFLLDNIGIKLEQTYRELWQPVSWLNKFAWYF